MGIGVSITVSMLALVPGLDLGFMPGFGFGCSRDDDSVISLASMWVGFVSLSLVTPMISSDGE